MANEITKERGYQVSIHNNLIQKSRYQLTKLEQKAVLYMVSKITPNDEPYKEYSFSAEQFCKVCNFNMDGGWYLQHVKEVMIELRKKAFVIKLEDGSEAITGWFNDAVLEPKTGIIRISFSRYLMPYLFELQRCFTSFSLEYVLPMNSEYGIRLYEYLKSVKYQGYKKTITLDELRELTGCEGRYKQSSDIRKRVIEPALEDINTYSDLKIEYRFIKQGKKVVAVEFYFIEMDDTAHYIRYTKRKAALTPQEEAPTDDLPY